MPWAVCRARARADPWSVFIFQLPPMNGLRWCMGYCPRQKVFAAGPVSDMLARIVGALALFVAARRRMTMTAVAVIGGGPAGATLGALLRKYDPQVEVLILEKERFPREHIGESMLPAIGAIMHEMGAWDKVEAEGFPIKLGGSLTS